MENRLNLKGKIKFESSDAKLKAGFDWAKKQALAYVFEGDLVGDWYEASLPGRGAFCMRDVSHQSIGAQALGLAPHNKNMLDRFALSISESKDFCGFWEIDKDYKPCPVDYTSDDDFWYNLPANFDVIDTCYRMYCWTNEDKYINGLDFNRFYDLSLNQYIKHWDRDNDGIPEACDPPGRRGIAGYDESDAEKNSIVMLDLIVIQARSFYAYAQICKAKGDFNQYHNYIAKYQSLKNKIETEWYDHTEENFYFSMNKDQSKRYCQTMGSFCMILYHCVIDDPKILNIALAKLDLSAKNKINVEAMSYLSTLYYRHDQLEHGYEWFLRQTDPSLGRREYPEVSFCAVGHIVEGVMGIAPNAYTNTVETLSRLLDGNEAKVSDLPIFDGTIDVEHTDKRTIFTNNTTKEFTWIAKFYGKHSKIKVLGEEKPALFEKTFTKKDYSYAIVDVKPSQTVCCELI